MIEASPATQPQWDVSDPQFVTDQADVAARAVDHVDDFLSPAERAAKNDEPMHLVLARDLIAKRQARDDTAAAKSEAEKQFIAAQNALNEYMVEHSMEPFRCDGHSVGASFTPQVSVLAANRLRLAEALREHGHGALVRDELRIEDDQLERVQQIMLDLGVDGAVESTPTVHPSRLKAFVAEQRKEHGGQLPEWLAELVTVYDQPTINLRKVT